MNPSVFQRDRAAQFSVPLRGRSRPFFGRVGPPTGSGGPARSGGRRVALAAASVAGVAVWTVGAAPGATALSGPVVRSVQQVDSQDIAPQAGSEPDTVVEPDVAVSPIDPDVAVAAAHDGRFPDGAAVAISHAWTRDGGRTWHHAPVPGLTLATGGSYQRASDPVLAFGPDGTAYLSALVIDFTGCRSGVLVSTSRDGGRTFGVPVAAHASADCNLSDDKNWITVDTNPGSPHRGRIYQFWSVYTATATQQWVTWSDDHAAHWSTPVVITPGDTTATQNSQPLIHPDGTVTDVYLDFTGLPQRPDPERPRAVSAAGRQAAAPAGIPLRARSSRDGGRTWSVPVTVTTDTGGDVPGVRAGLPSGTVDPVTGQLSMIWESVDNTQVRLSRSFDGRHWSAPATVNAAPVPTTFIVNADVTARDGVLVVSYGTQDTTVEAGRYVRQQVAVSHDGGGHFRAPFPIGPRSDLNFSANAGGHFPGDYIGTATARNGWVYAVWAVSSPPPTPGATYHQVIEGAVLRP